MDVKEIVKMLDVEITTLTRARDILSGETRSYIKHDMSNGNFGSQPRAMSAATKKRMSLAMKRRWRDKKAAGKHSL